MLWTLVVTLNFKDYMDHLLDGDLNERATTTTKIKWGAIEKKTEL